MPEIKWDNVVREWVCNLPDGTTIWHADKTAIESMLDRLDEQQERNRENRSVVTAIIVGSFVLGLAAVVAALISG